MKKLILVSALSMAMVLPAHASTVKEEVEHHPLIGMGAGALAGAAVAGPVGGMVGAVMGLFIGKVEGDKQVIAQQEGDLVKSAQSIVALTHKTDNYQRVLADNEKLNDEVTALKLQKLNNLMAMTVQFKTGSSTIEPHFESQLLELALILNDNTEIELDLHGFADQRGDEQANLALSQQRVDSVSDFLIKHGVSHQRLTRHALGESNSLASNASFEDDFFDRRVTVTAKPMSQMTATAKNQY